MLVQTTQTQATGEFFHAYRMNQQQPLTLLCLAVAHVQQAMRRSVDDRNRTVLQAFAFLQVSIKALLQQTYTDWISGLGIVSKRQVHTLLSAAPGNALVTEVYFASTMHHAIAKLTCAADTSLKRVYCEAVSSAL